MDREIERLLEARGFALVALERGGSRRRPLLRLRVERPDDPPGRSSLTAEDCAGISRDVLAHFAESGEDGDWILEVSSPGVERPLTRPADYDRFAGCEVRLSGYGPLRSGRRQVEGRLRGTEAGGDGARVVVLEEDGETLRVPLGAIARAHLVYRPGDDI